MFGALLATGSYIGIAIGLAYILYLFLNRVIQSFRVSQSVSVIDDEKSSISRTFSGTLFGRFLTRDRDKRVRNDKIRSYFLPVVFTLIIAIFFVLVGYFLIPTDKFLSFVGRWVLMHEVWMELIRFPAGLVT